MKKSFTIEKVIKAPIDRVFEAITDHRGYASMTPLRKSTLDKEGTPAPNGLGAVRRLVAVGPAIVEEVVTYEPPNRFAYKALSGLPVSDHLGEATLFEQGASTRVSYTINYTPSFPAGEYVVGPALKFAISGLLKGVAKRVE
jgi:uncharacterized protein YndB with AHSA1/START domain